MIINAKYFLKYAFGSRIYDHCFQFQSSKWIVSLNLMPPELVHKGTEGIKPISNYTSIWMRFVDRQSFFKKGRQQFISSFKINDVIRLTNWNFDKQKFKIIKNSQYNEEVISIQKTKEQNYALTFFNNKVNQQKYKQIIFNRQEFILFQQTLKSAFLGLTFSDQRYQSQNFKIFNQIKPQQTKQ